MLLDFHTHAKLAKKIAFSATYTDWLFEGAKAAGLDAICLTDHFLTRDFDLMYKFIEANAESDGDTLIYKGLRVFPGMETHIRKSGHILTIGPVDAILELNRILEPHKMKKNLIPFDDLMDLYDDYPVMVGAAHPFRVDESVTHLSDEQLSRLDFLDLNGEELSLNRHRTEALTYGLGERLHIPVVGGSDTHQANQYGCVATAFENDMNTVDALCEAVNTRDYDIIVSDRVTDKVREAGALKLYLKAVQRDGGDYAAVLPSVSRLAG